MVYALVSRLMSTGGQRQLTCFVLGQTRSVYCHESLALCYNYNQECIRSGDLSRSEVTPIDRSPQSGQNYLTILKIEHWLCMCALSNLNKMAISMQHWQCVLLFLVLVGKFRLVLALIKLAVLMHSCYNSQAPFLIPSSKAFLLFIICRVHTGK